MSNQGKFEDAAKRNRSQNSARRSLEESDESQRKHQEAVEAHQRFNRQARLNEGLTQLNEATLNNDQQNQEADRHSNRQRELDEQNTQVVQEPMRTRQPFSDEYLDAANKALDRKYENDEFVSNRDQNRDMDRGRDDDYGQEY